MKRKWTLVGPLVLVALAMSGCADRSKDKAPGAASAQAEAELFKRMTVDELAAKMDEAKAGKLALRIYDNNEKDRFVSGHIPSATWVKFDDVKASDLPADKETTLVFYCANDH